MLGISGLLLSCKKFTQGKNLISRKRNLYYFPNWVSDLKLKYDQETEIIWSRKHARSYGKIIFLTLLIQIIYDIIKEKSISLNSLNVGNRPPYGGIERCSHTQICDMML